MAAVAIAVVIAVVAGLLMLGTRESANINTALVVLKIVTLALFVGVVRDHDHGEPVSSLDYSAHPTVVDALREVCEQVAARHPVSRLGAVHRVGHLDIGDVAVVAAVSAAHRGEAFEACRDLVDTLKSTVPIWKHQQFSDGSDDWVGLP